MPAAATGIAKRESSTVNIYFLAAKNKNIDYLENPLQTPAYYYPQKYGIESPSFSRASVLSLQGKNRLFVSGTASILGSETVFENNLLKQFETTVNNISTLISRQNFKAHNLDDGYTLNDIEAVKVYYRKSEDRDIIIKLCEERFSNEAKIHYLNVDICRKDLLLEIEAYL